MLNLQAVEPMETENDADGEQTNNTESVSTSQSSASATRRTGTSRTRPPAAGSNNRQIVNWSGLQFHERDSDKDRSQQPFAHLKDVILLDTGSTLKATFMNPDMVTNVKISDAPVSMTTNSGNKMLGLEASVPGHGQVWFDPDQIANIYGFSHMVDKHRITYDSDVEDAFLVHTKGGVTKFARTPDGLYASKPSEEYRRRVAESNNQIRQYVDNVVATVKENSMGYTQRQFERAKEAQSILLDVPP